MENRELSMQEMEAVNGGHGGYGPGEIGKKDGCIILTITESDVKNRLQVKAASYGVTVAAIVKVNPGLELDKLVAGRVIYMPKK